MPDFRESESFGGFHVGAGFEAVVSGGIYGRLEYVYSDYGAVEAREEDLTARLKPTRHQVTYGMGIRF